MVYKVKVVRHFILPYGVDGKNFETLFSFLYTKKGKLTKDNIQDLDFRVWCYTNLELDILGCELTIEELRTGKVIF